ncbi:hypothetical protein EI94DRAFT_1833595 [Lactarius quietus]|nr:hypothetical protein EI94DRAFT_1833595 [Lactarius quietus]
MSSKLSSGNKAGSVSPFPRLVNGSYDFRGIEEKAREVTKDNHSVYLYIFDTARISTYRNNLEILEQWRIVPRMLRNGTDRNLEARTADFSLLLGELTPLPHLRPPYLASNPSPVLLAPVGIQAIIHKEGERATARASVRVGVPLIMSTASSRSIEAVAKANGDGYRWYQLAWPRNNDVTLSILGRAKAAGFNALVVTLDPFSIGWRPHDLKTACVPFGAGVGKKGVQTPEDAHAAMDARMDGIAMSNHGGRQIDGGISSFSALEKITASSRVPRAQNEGKFMVLFDSGIRKGSDVIKAIAMGTQGVAYWPDLPLMTIAVGRPFMYGLTIGGEHGVGKCSEPSSRIWRLPCD